MRKLPIYLGLLVALAVVVELLWHTPLQKGGEAPPVTTPLTVVDALSGAPVADATVTRLLASGEDLGDPLPVSASGRLDLAVGGPRLVRVAAQGYQSRILAVGPGPGLTVLLTEDGPTALTVRVAGEVMMGRRFYLPAPGAAAPLLASPTDQDGHERLLEPAAPLLADADLTVAALATPLVPDPYVAGTVPPGYRTDRPLLLAGAPATADALAGAGVDVVGLADDHVMDALDVGLQSTLAALDEAGLAHFGAGATAAEAWAPAYVDVRDQTVAFLGCTTIVWGRGPATSSASAVRAGVARCSPDRLRAEVTAAAAQADAVVVSIGGAARPGSGAQAARLQADVRRLAGVAADAGASFVTGGYPHQTSAVVPIGDVPWIQGTGDLVFDHQTWSRLLSSVPKVSLAGSRVSSLVVDPLALIDGRPTPVVGSVADAVARRMSTGSAEIGFGVGVAYWPTLGATRTETWRVDSGGPARLAEGSSLTALAPGQRAGRDLLFGTGSMEALDTDAEATGSTLWALGKYVTTSLEAGCDGAQGVRLRRGPLSAKDVVISPQHRAPVRPGTRLTLTANVRLASDGASLEVRWYRTLDPTKRSSGAESVAIEPHRLAGPCSPVRLDLVVPEGMVAAQPYIRLSPRHDVNLAAELRVDDVRLIAWSPAGRVARNLDTVEGAGDATLVATAMP